MKRERERKCVCAAMVSDGRIVQLAGAALVVCGLVAISTMRTLLRGGLRVGDVSETNQLAWSPRDFVFGLMWSVIFASQGVFALSTAIVSLLNTDATDLYSLFTNCACAGSGLLMASVWEPLFVANTPWAIAASAALLVCVAAVTTLGAVASKPFFNDSWWECFGAISTSFFAGWTLTAAGLSIGITTRVYNRGLNAVSTKTGMSPFPLVLSIVVCVLSVVFANPVLSAPLFIALLTVPGVFKSWWLWVPVLVTVCGIAGGVVMLYVYREGSVWW